VFAVYVTCESPGSPKQISPGNVAMTEEGRVKLDPARSGLLCVFWPKARRVLNERSLGRVIAIRKHDLTRFIVDLYVAVVILKDGLLNVIDAHFSNLAMGIAFCEEERVNVFVGTPDGRILGQEVLDFLVFDVDVAFCTSLSNRMPHASNAYCMT
jgi:hypothetical protein